VPALLLLGLLAYLLGLLLGLLAHLLGLLLGLLAHLLLWLLTRRLLLDALFWLLELSVLGLLLPGLWLLLPTLPGGLILLWLFAVTAKEGTLSETVFRCGSLTLLPELRCVLLALLVLPLLLITLVSHGSMGGVWR